MNANNVAPPSTQYLSSAGEDKTVHMWKVEDWQVTEDKCRIDAFPLNSSDEDACIRWRTS